MANPAPRRSTHNMIQGSWSTPCRLPRSAGQASTAQADRRSHGTVRAGNCVHPPKSGLCDDGNECTVGDTCADGICVPGGPAPAGTPCGAPIDLCGTSRCDGLGACVRDPAPDGVACNDGDACTTGDTCRGGTCVGGPTTSCGPCRVCEPQRGCIPVRSAGCPAPRVRRPRKLRIDCHDGTIENQPVDPLCDVDHAADGTCTFAPRCPLC